MKELSPKSLQKQLKPQLELLKPRTNGKPSTKSIDELLRLHKRKLKQDYGLIKSRVHPVDRSDAMYALGARMVEAGIPRGDAYVILQSLSWNKFRGRSDEDEQLWNCLPLQVEGNGRPKHVAGVPSENLFHLLGQDLPTPKFMIENWWGDRNFGMIAGPAKTHKTWLAMDLAVSVASGMPFLNQYEVNDPGPVLFLEAEVRRRSMAYRLKLIAENRGLGSIWDEKRGRIIHTPTHPVHLWRDTHIDLGDDETVSRIAEEAQRVDAAMVILDPLQMMIGELNENSASDMRKALLPLSELSVQLGIGVCVVHHFKKESSDPKARRQRGGQRASGSQFFHGWVETGIWVDYVNDYTIRCEREFRDMDPQGDAEIEFLIVDDKYTVEVDSWKVVGGATVDKEKNDKDKEIRGKRDAVWNGRLKTTRELVTTQPGITVAQLGDRLQVSRQYARRIANYLEEQKKVELRAIAPSGKRGRPGKGLFWV